MTTKERVNSIFLTFVLSIICLVPLFEFKVHANEKPKDLYRVYLNGKSIGVIESKDRLEKYINDEQKELKEKYNVDNVHLPNGLYISNYSSYNYSEVVREEVLYQLIKETEDFTIKGYQIEIKTEDEPIIINVLNKEDFENSINSVVKAFVPSEDLELFLKDEQVVIKDFGKNIEDLYIKENVTIKESYIPSTEKIFVDEKELTKYLLFGEEVNEKKYRVREGDTIESIAESNQLAVEELLVVNQDLKSKNNILSIGEEISVALISPVITVVLEEHSVEEKTIAYTTEVQYSNSIPWGTSEIKQQGKDGKQKVTQKIKYENGEIVTALIADTEVLEEVVNSIKVVGTMSAATIDPSDIPDSGDWYWPTLSPYIITSPYGWRWGAMHEGVDISGTGHGSPIFSANNGVVYRVFTDNIGGKQIIVAHANGYYTMYAHMASQNVVAGQQVTRGQKIGTMGSTGVSTGTHLHFAVYKGIPYRGGIHFNPMTLYR